MQAVQLCCQRYRTLQQSSSCDLQRHDALRTFASVSFSEVLSSIATGTRWSGSLRLHGSSIRPARGICDSRGTYVRRAQKVDDWVPASSFLRTGKGLQLPARLRSSPEQHASCSIDMRVALCAVTVQLLVVDLLNVGLQAAKEQYMCLLEAVPRQQG